MQRYQGHRLYSATDLVGFLDCEHLTALDLAALDDRALAAQRNAADESAALIARKGVQHEQDYLEALRRAGRQVIDIAVQADDIDERAAKTLDAMRSGAEVIYQATLRNGVWIGHADFLRRIDDEPSDLGGWRYEVADTKLARSPKAKFLVQLAFYSDLVAKAQGAMPRQMHVVLGDGTERAYRSADYMHYFAALRERFVAAVAGLDDRRLSPPYPVPCDHCDLCRWQARCDAQRLADDHLCQVAGITRIQTGKLEQAGITTLVALGNFSGSAVPRMHAETLTKLRGQAALQHGAKVTGVRRVEILPLDPDRRRGFFRLPQPDAGDMFFDMEGDPLQQGGLEYLFGVGFLEQGSWTFRPFWGHDRTQERIAFEQFIDFVVERRSQYPAAHVYHYASYEESALKRLASLHATREVEVDDFLRQGVLIDLYKVVREALRVSEPSYSIKYIERFYRPQREGDVQTAGASIVTYERWRESGDPKFLDDIESYNRDDVESTQQLRDWLLTHRPAHVAWRASGDPKAGADDAPGEQAPSTVQQMEERLARYRAAMVDVLPADRLQWPPQHHLSELTYQLLAFHRRAAKPGWWALFSRKDLSEDELAEDPECLAGLTLDVAHPPVKVARSMQYTYLAPEQESKLSTGDDVTRCDTAQNIGTLEFDEATRRVRLKIGPKKEPLPARLDIGPKGPLDAEMLTEAVFRFADSVLAGDGRYDALLQFLLRQPPRLSSRVARDVVVAPAADLVPGCVAAVRSLDNSYLYVQGPPGAGKTYTGARLIAALLADGYRVGVTSNSHKAINHLMAEALREAKRQGLAVRAVKKANKDRPDSELHVAGSLVANAYANKDVWADDANLIGGTAWLFSDPVADQQLDFLFVDEAGQVTLANLVAAGTAARNLVLLGDQMQLSQPIQGVHPGRSGDSALDYLLDGSATIAPDRGVFLATTWRMHPAVCRFISDAVYDGRLEAEPANAKQSLLLNADAHPLLRPVGIVHAPIEHQGCSQRSDEEAALVAELYASALAQRYADRHGDEHAVGPANILVVAPYNMQVRRLQQTLPDGARVGTVDKFQGQEAEIVIVSMTTSSEQDLPRHIEFLYSKNRLNVAVSRAKCLAIVVANPALMAIKCSTPEQMALVNTLCWVAEVGRAN